MAKHAQAGFTLIEIIIVMAISSLLLMIAWLGQGSLRAQAEFDNAVNKIASSVNDARNQSIAGVNIVGEGNGDDAAPCPGSSGKVMFAGTLWEANNSLPDSPFKRTYYKTDAGAAACEFQSEAISAGFAPDLRITSVSVPGKTATSGSVAFVRTPTGGLVVCPMTDPPATPIKDVFAPGNCPAGTGYPFAIEFTDDRGHKSRLEVDQSGLAKRMF